jgi:hypothetical protein
MIVKVCAVTKEFVSTEIDRLAATPSNPKNSPRSTMMQETEMTDVKEETPVAVPLDDIEDDEDEETKKKRNRERSFWTKLWQGLAAASLALNLAAMVIVGSGITIAMGVIACVVAPVVIKQQMDLQDTDSKLCRLLCVDTDFNHSSDSLCSLLSFFLPFSTSTCPEPATA